MSKLHTHKLGESYKRRRNEQSKQASVSASLMIMTHRTPKKEGEEVSAIVSLISIVVPTFRL